MKSVIFICLLSLSACLSDQSQTQDATPMGQDQGNKVPANSKAQTIAVQSASKNSSEAASNVPGQSAGVSATPPSSTPVQNVSSNDSTLAQANSNLTPTTTNGLTQNITKADTNQTANKLPETKENEAKPTDGNVTTSASKNETATATTGKMEKNSTMTDDKEKKGTNTTKAEVVKPTEAPPLQTRSFDGPSFIGGIILTLGLIAVSFMGYKYYKNQTERNYYGTL